MEVLNGNNRFNTLLKDIPGINPRTLSTRLAEFRQMGLIRRETAAADPLRVSYSLTRKGEEMRQLFREIAGFSLKWHHQTNMGIEREGIRI